MNVTSALRPSRFSAAKRRSMRVSKVIPKYPRPFASHLHTEMLGHRENIFVAPSTHVHDQKITLRQCWGKLANPCERMGWLQRRYDPLEPGAELESFQCLLVRHRDVGDTTRLLEPGVLRPDAGIVEASGDGVTLEDLPVVVLQQVGAIAMQHAGLAAGHRRTVAIGHIQSVPPGFHTVDLDVLVVEERMEEADRIGAAADAGHQRIWQPAFSLHHLLTNFLADDRLE